MPKIPTRLRGPLIVASFLVIGGLASIDDGDGALVFGVLSLLVLGIVLLPVLSTRRRMRDRRDTMSLHEGVWRAHSEPLRLAPLLGLGRRGGFLRDRLPLDVAVTPEALVISPVGRLAAWQGYETARVPWDQVAEVRAGDRTWKDGGKIALTGLTPVTFVLVGGAVDELYRPMTEAERVEEGMTEQEREEYDAENEQDARDELGPDYVFGTWPVTLRFDDADGLVERATRWRRGAMPG